MMCRTAIVFWLRADPGVAAIVANRVHPIQLPQSPVYPASVVQTVSDPGLYHLRGRAGLSKARLQIDNYVQIKPGVDAVDLVDRLAAAVDAALGGKSFRQGAIGVRVATRTNDIDYFEEPEINAYRVLLEYLVSYSPL